MRALARRNGEVSFWQAALGAPPLRPPLPGDRDADVCIVGAGFTGLWTAYRLALARPSLRIVVLEREWAGFGASGRNGGWLTPAFAGRPHAGTRRALQDSVAGVLAVCAAERIDCDAHAGGVLRVARGPAQAARLRAAVAAEEDVVELDADALAQRVRVAGASAAAWSPHGARVQPAKLVRGLAAAAERRGVQLFERTAVRELLPAGGPGGRDAAVAVTERGVVRAPVVLACVEGFTPQLRGRRRALLPLNSAIVVTEPLRDDAWAAIGWAGAELLGDAAHAYVYAQRTADGRIALGGRGVPYRYGSRTDRAGRTQRRTVAGLARTLHALFPAAADAALDHAWCGVLGVARDWQPAVRLDRASGLGFAGGYVGNGLAASELAGRTLRDLVLGERSELTELPWVGHVPRRWEPEPLRWLGARGVYALYRAADRREAASRSARTSRLALAADRLAGR
ncbi:MAG: FAD-dependent oxidoreductase [Actinobacteria bacterium]|nr:FAD-dependent oxidoreductase [Actinomycetota bacterium]